MKKFTLIVLVALMAAATSFAQQQERKARPAAKSALNREQVVRSGRQQLQQPSQLKAVANKAPRRAAGITEQPEGKVYENLIYAYQGIAYSWLYGWYNSSSDADVATIVEAEDGTLYIQNLLTQLYDDEYYWIKAEKVDADGYNYVIHKQPAGYYEYYDEVDYITRLEYVDGYYYEAADTDIKLNWKDGVLTTVDEFASGDIGLGIVYEDYDEDEDAYAWYWDGAVYWDIRMQLNQETITTVPEDATVEDMVISYQQATDNYAKMVRVAFVGSDVYLYLYDNTEGWIKGSIDGNRVVVKNRQYMGVDSRYNAHQWAHAVKTELMYYEDDEDESYNYYYDQATIVDEVVFAFDPETKTMTLSDGDAIYVDGAPERIYYATYFKNAVIKYFEEVVAVPADPQITYFYDYDDYYESAELDFSLSTTDVDGNYILPTKLFYTVYADDEVFEFETDEYESLDENTTELPYGFNDEDGWIGASYVCLFFQPAENVGMQTIYKGGDAVRKSNIVFYDVNTYETTVVPFDNTTVSVKGVSEQAGVSSEAYYDLTGRQVRQGAQGFVVKTLRMADGSQKSYKVVRR